MKLLSLTLLFFLFIIFNTFAKPNIAVVIKTRGLVTRLYPGEMTARKLKVGDFLKEDTSILTRKGSFVRIRFINDRSLINVGPSSKIVIINSQKRKPTLIGLLKGTIRAKINRNANSTKHKFFVKTRHAALGVRGTDFETIYNPNNNITSLVTFKGEVALVKTGDDLNENLEGEENNQSSKIVSRDEKKPNKIKVTKINHQETNIIKKIDKMFNNRNSVIVKRGQFAGTYNNLNKVSKPVSIHPGQLNAMYSNNDLIVKQKKNISKKALNQFAKDTLLLKSVKQTTPPEGFFNKQTGDFAPRSGGVIDFKTAIYVAPSQGSRLDQNSNVYIDKSIGSIDRDTGQYIAPKGLELDENHGFVISKRYAKNKKNLKKLTNKKEKLNNSITKKVLFGTNKLESKSSSIEYYNNYELESHHLLGFSFTPRQYQSGDGPNNRRSAENTSFFQASWTQPALFLWQPIFKLGVKQFKVNKNKNQDLVDNNLSYFDLYAGLRKNISNRFSLEIFGNFFQDALISHIDDGGGNGIKNKIVSGVFTRTGATFSYKVLNYNRFSINTDVTGFAQLGVDADQISLSKSLGIRYDLYISWWLNRKTMIKLGGYGSFFNTDVKRQDFSGQQITEKKVPFEEGDVKVDFIYVL